MNPIGRNVIEQVDKTDGKTTAHYWIIQLVFDQDAFCELIDAGREYQYEVTFKTVSQTTSKESAFFNEFGGREVFYSLEETKQRINLHFDEIIKKGANL